MRKMALRRAAPGPYRWALPTDLWRLRSSYGLPFRFRALSWTAFASQARVHHLEASACGGLHVGARLRALRSWRSDSPHIVRAALWSPWLDSAHVKILSDAVEKLTQISASPRQAEAVLAKGSPRPWPRAVALAVRRGLQRWMTSALEQARPGDAEERMRAKLARWHLPGFPRLVAGRVLGRLRDLAGRVPPRVQAAVLGSLFNRWVTGRRFQRRYEGGCLLGCG